MANKTMLLYMTDFYGYNKEVIYELEKKDWNVIWYQDKVALNSFERIYSKLNQGYQIQKFDNYFDRSILQNRGKKVDLILIINGGWLKESNIQSLRKEFVDTPIVYYAWDSVSSYPTIKNLFKCVDYPFSFDRLDSEKYNVNFLPLFYVPSYNEDEKIRYDCSVVMTFNAEKAPSLKKSLQLLPATANKKIYLKIGSWLTLQKMRLTNSREIAGLEQYFYMKSLSHKSVMKIFNQSKVVIDCPLPTQNGLTIRTLEVLSIQKKLITSNKDIKNYEFYTPDNIFVIDENTKEIPKKFFDTPFNRKYSLSTDYSVSHFVEVLVSAPKKRKWR